VADFTIRPLMKNHFTYLVAIIALLVAVAPASAKPTRPSASTAATATLAASSWFPGAYCTFDVSYRWSGIKGSGFTASVNLVDASGATIASAPQVRNVSGSGTVEFVFNFTGSVGASRNIYTRGSLLSNGVEVSGSVATSPGFASSCGGSYGVRSFTTIDLS